jgi:TonB-dependent SusC/RagA subfamily outer membrane receptor
MSANGVRATIALLSALVLSTAAQAEARAVPSAFPSVAAVAGRAGAAYRAVPQQSFVRGIVVAEGTLGALAGAQVVLEGTQRGTLTDAAGRFRIENVPGTQVTLRVVMLGYKTATQQVQTGQAEVRIVLERTALDLEGLVVTGTAGRIQKRALGNSLAQIDGGTLTEREPITSVGDMLQGRAAGVSVNDQMGVAGGGQRILIRGPGSLSFSGNPLIYVDGIRINSDPNTGPSYGQAGGAGAPSVVSRLNDINPEDIERIEIIKGPSATTLYGTEASAGVIQIFTKRASQGAATWTASIEQGFAHEQKLDYVRRCPCRFLITETHEGGAPGIIDHVHDARGRVGNRLHSDPRLRRRLARKRCRPNRHTSTRLRRTTRGAAPRR